MKMNKLAYMLCLALAVGSASCSNDKEWEQDINTASGTTVQFTNAAISVKEGAGVVSIPLEVTGDQNGRVTVTLSVEPYSEAGAIEAIEDTHYIFTSKTVNIFCEDKTADAEFSTIDDSEINESRMFKVTIVKAEGASAIGENNSCIVTLRDNDSAFYEKLQGKWTMTSTGSKGSQSWDVTITGYDEGEEGYEEVLYIIGLNGRSYCEAELDYDYDVVTGTRSLSIPYGSFCASDINFTGLGVCDVYLAGVSGGYFDLQGQLNGTWSDDFNTITFETGKTVYGALVQDGSLNGYTWFRFSNPVLTRK